MGGFLGVEGEEEVGGGEGEGEGEVVGWRDG